MESNYTRMVIYSVRKSKIMVGSRYLGNVTGNEELQWQVKVANCLWNLKTGMFNFS